MGVTRGATASTVNRVIREAASLLSKFTLEAGAGGSARIKLQKENAIYDISTSLSLLSLPS
jgi:hypothetical protein